MDLSSTGFEKFKNLLIVDDEENMRHMLSILLKNAGYTVDSAQNGVEAIEKITRTTYDFILCDLKMPKMDGMSFLKEARDRLQQTTVIVMSAFGSIDTAIEAMKLGAYDFISKPFKTDEVLMALKKADERESLKRENSYLKEQLKKIEEQFKFGNMVAQSHAMKIVFDLAKKAAQYNTTVLITGESGTGKELIAKGIHFSSNRSSKSIVAVNCGGIPENLLESELFGYKRGAFTGADRDRKGLFEEAHNGTIFLDEIGEMPLSLQVKLLRVLQENEIRPVGDVRSKTIDVRVIAATSKHLEEEIRQGRFREDLFYRLNVFPVSIPPLRKRKEEIPVLIQHFITAFNQKLGKNVEGISPSAMNQLLGYDWFGNVRELENMIERACILSEGKLLLSENFPSDIFKPTTLEETEPLAKMYSLKEAQKILEKKLIVKALKETRGNRTQAAKLLEISHPSLLSKMKSYNINDL